MTDPFAVLSKRNPDVDVQDVHELLAAEYQLSGQLKPLDSERDQNFRLDTSDGQQFAVKIANLVEDPAVTDFQSQALLHIEHTDPSLPLPRVIRTGNDEIALTIADREGQEHQFRVLTWCNGVPMEEAGDGKVGRPLGQCMGRLNRALHGFSHPAQDYKLLWDITHANLLDHHTVSVEEDDIRKLCEEQLQRFARDTRPVLDDLRWQVIHNDLNPGNVLVDPNDNDKVAGIIDFGDVVRAPLIVDLAVAAAYLSRADSNPFEEVLDMLTAFSGEIPLDVAEIDVLFDLILTRCAIGVIIASWRAVQFPENRKYILISREGSLAKLAQFSSFDRNEVRDQFHAACEAAD